MAFLSIAPQGEVDNVVYVIIPVRSPNVLTEMAARTYMNTEGKVLKAKKDMVRKA